MIIFPGIFFWILFLFAVFRANFVELFACDFKMQLAAYFISITF